MLASLRGKKVLIIAGGEIRDYKFYRSLIRKSDLIICVNGGTAHAKKFGIKPDYIIGDLDSIKPSRRGSRLKSSTLKFPAQKNYSDTELAIRLAIKKGAGKIVVIGATGKRIDHTIANILAAGLYPGKVTLIDEFAELKVHEKSFSITGKKGDTVSLLPFFTTVRRLNGRGFKYSIENLDLAPGARGLSNVLTATKANINFKKGKLLCIRAKER